jgi:hypothetical protein
MHAADADLGGVAARIARRAGRLAAGRARRSPDGTGGRPGERRGAAPQRDAGLARIRVASELSALAATALQLSVQRARAAGCTWQEIGDVLGVSRQAAFQRFGRPAQPRPGDA